MNAGATLAGRVVVILGPADPGIINALRGAGLRAATSSGDITVWAGTPGGLVEGSAVPAPPKRRPSERGESVDRSA